MKFRARQGTKLLLSAAMITALYLWIDWPDLAGRLVRIAWVPFGVAAILNMGLVVLNACKISMLFPKPQPALPGLVKVNFISVFYNTFIPGGIGGELARWAYLGRESGSGSRSMAAILLDRITGLWTQIIMALGAWIWISRGGVGLWISVPATASILAVSLWAGLWGYRGSIKAMRALGTWFTRRSPDAGTDPERIAESLAELLANRTRLAAVAGMSALYQMLVVAVFLLLDRSVGGHLSWENAMLILFSYTVIQLVPLSPGNLGFSEGTLALLYHYTGAQSAFGVMISLLMRAVIIPAAALGWAFFLAGPRPAQHPAGKRLVPDGAE